MPAEVVQRLRPGILGHCAIVTGASIPEEPMLRARIDVHGAIGHLCLKRPISRTCSMGAPWTHSLPLCNRKVDACPADAIRGSFRTAVRDLGGAHVRLAPTSPPLTQIPRHTRDDKENRTGRTPSLPHHGLQVGGNAAVCQSIAPPWCSGPRRRILRTSSCSLSKKTIR